jgi:hypothetical protein
LGTPVPDCQEGLEYPETHSVSGPSTVSIVVDEEQLLSPPPPPTRSEPVSDTPVKQPFTDPEFAQVSFHAISGMYDMAEDRVVELFDEDQ